MTNETPSENPSENPTDPIDLLIDSHSASWLFDLEKPSHRRLESWELKARDQAARLQRDWPDERVRTNWICLWFPEELKQAVLRLLTPRGIFSSKHDKLMAGAFIEADTDAARLNNVQSGPIKASLDFYALEVIYMRRARKLMDSLITDYAMALSGRLENIHTRRQPLFRKYALSPQHSPESTADLISLARREAGLE